MAKKTYIEEITEALQEKPLTVCQIENKIRDTPTKIGQRQYKRKQYPSAYQIGNYVSKNPKLFKKTGKCIHATCMRGHGKGYPQPLWTLTK